MVKALIAVTSYNEPFYADGKKTGLFLTEALHPFEVFRAQGYDVDFVSETGTFGYDEHSLGPDFLDGDDKNIHLNEHSEFNIGLKNIKKPSQVDGSEYSIFFASAGHGTLFDYPKASGLQELAQKIYAKGGVVAAVCHGPAIFANLIDTTTGRPIVEGKTATGFTDKGEEQMQVDTIMKSKNLESVEALYKRLGAKFSAPAGPWDDHSVVDGRIVTGVNPQSATSTAKKAVQVLSEVKGIDKVTG
jgi:putative intracellular protease/amidase